MAVLGVQMMMLKDQVVEQGMWPVLQRLAELDLHAVEVSQIAMDETNVAALERGHHSYIYDQRYSPKPSTHEVTRVLTAMAMKRTSTATPLASIQFAE